MKIRDIPFSLWCLSLRAYVGDIPFLIFVCHMLFKEAWHAYLLMIIFTCWLLYNLYSRMWTFQSVLDFLQSMTCLLADASFAFAQPDCFADWDPVDKVQCIHLHFLHSQHCQPSWLLKQQFVVCKQHSCCTVGEQWLDPSWHSWLFLMANFCEDDHKYARWFWIYGMPCPLVTYACDVCSNLFMLGMYHLCVLCTTRTHHWYITSSDCLFMPAWT